MQLTSLQVENYKCIEDSTEFQIDRVTYLVGKNEAGKSALLEALYKLNPVEKDKTEFDELDYPRRFVSTYRDRKDKEPANVLTTVWEVEKSDIHFLTASLGVNPLKTGKVTVNKGYDNTRTWVIDCDEQKIVAASIKEAKLKSDEAQKLKGAQSVKELFSQLEGLNGR